MLVHLLEATKSIGKGESFCHTAILSIKLFVDQKFKRSNIKRVDFTYNPCAWYSS